MSEPPRPDPPDDGAEHDITGLLQAWGQGHPEALDRLTPLVYNELHRIASIQFARESEGHTLQPTAVVHELFMDLLGRRRVQWQDRSQFFGFAARQMRRILVDHARRNRAAKRGGPGRDLPLEDLSLGLSLTDEALLRLDAALSDLARFNPDGCRVVELSFFVGLTHEEIAQLMGTSTSTVRNKWRAARAWLHRELEP